VSFVIVIMMDNRSLFPLVGEIALSAGDYRSELYYLHGRQALSQQVPVITEL
jgi:hypothetical protein